MVLFHAPHLILRVSYFLKHLFSPHVRLSMKGINRYIGFPTMRFDVVLIVLFLVGNAICIYVKDVASLVERFALLCTINLVPLTLGERMNPLANICRVRLGASASMHEWLGSVAIVEALVHTAAAMSSQHVNINTTSGVAELVVSHLYFLNL